MISYYYQNFTFKNSVFCPGSDLKLRIYASELELLTKLQYKS